MQQDINCDKTVSGRLIGCHTFRSHRLTDESCDTVNTYIDNGGYCTIVRRQKISLANQQKRYIMPNRNTKDDDDDTIITDLSDKYTKKLTHAKQEQLANARVRAIESRRKTQKAGLEHRLHEVKLLLGEIDPSHIQRAQEAMMSLERDLRREQKQLTLQFIELVRNESAKRKEENASIKRSIERTKSELEALMSKKASAKHSIVSLSEASGTLKR